jgi:superfamily II DNA or RNA helicase
MLEIRVSNLIHIPQEGTDELLLERIMERFCYPNPVYKKTKELGFNTRGIDLLVQNWQYTLIDWKNHLSIPRGQLVWLKNFLNENKVPFNITDERSTGFKFDVEWNDKFTPKEYQSRGVDLFLKYQQGFWCLNPGAGKTVLALLSIAKTKTSSLIICNSNELMSQWKEEIKKFLHYDDEVGIIQQKKAILKPITIASIQTLINWDTLKIQELNEYFGACYHDEAHHGAAKETLRAITPLSQKYKMALTASKTRKDELEFLIYDHYDKIRLEEKGDTLVPTVTQINTGINIHWTRKTPWQKLESDLGANESRNELIKSEIQEDLLFGHRVLCLFSRNDAAKNMHRLLQEEGVKSICLVSGDDINLKKLKKDVETREVEVIVGCRIFDEGIDIPSLSSIHLCSPSNNKEGIRQRTGRVNRIWGGKIDPKVVDYVDNIQPCKASALKRMQWYKEFGYKVPTSFAARLNSLWMELIS